MGITCSSKKETKKEIFQDLPQINVNKVNKKKRPAKNEKQAERDKTVTTQKSPQTIQKQFLQPDDEYMDSLKYLPAKESPLKMLPQTLPQLNQIPLVVNGPRTKSEHFQISQEKPQSESKQNRRQPRISKDLNPDEVFTKIASKLYGKNRQDIIFKTIKERY